MEPSETPDKSKGFFQTLPGIITGIAALITALGGLIITLNQTGCFSARSTVKDAVTDNVQKADNVSGATNAAVESKDKNAERTPANNSSSNISFSPTTINYSVKQIAFVIKDAKVEPLSSSDVFFKIKIKVVNDSHTGFNFGESMIRVKLDEDKYEPDASTPTDYYVSTVDAQTFKVFEFYFKLPATAKKFDVLLYDYKEQVASSSFQLK